MPDNRGAALGRIAVDHPGQLVALAGGLGYLVGYINARAMAAGLGVGPSDLGLTTNDHVVSAAAWVALFLPLVAFTVWMQGKALVGWRTSTGFALLASAGFATVVVVTIGTTSSSVFWALTALFVFSIIAAAGWWIGGPGLTLTLTLAASLVGLLPPASYDFGRQIRMHPELGHTVPVWLKLVLPLDEGTAQFGTGAACVIRISDRVYATRATVRIEPSPVRFQRADCFAK